VNPRSSPIRTALLVVSMTLFLLSPGSNALAAGQPPAPKPPAGLQLTASPSLVDVGDFETFTLSATSWPARASVSLSFLSGHHGFTGAMTWGGSCGCFRVAVDLARRIHPTEGARAAATVRYDRTAVVARALFRIKGLAPNGRDYSPGGTPALTQWVSEQDPIVNTEQHFCAWVKTEDGLGVPGYRVTFVVRFSYGARSWYMGTTGSSGLICTHRSIGKTRAKFRVTVDVYANSLHGRTSFVPRSS